MTTEKDIQIQIEKDVLAYNNSIFDGNIPANFIEMFKKAVMAIPAGVHKIKVEYIRQIIGKKDGEFTIVDIGLITNLIYQSTPSLIFETIEEYLIIMDDFSKLSDDYNKKNAEFEKKILKKKKTLLSLSGITNSAPFSNGLQVVPTM